MQHAAIIEAKKEGLEYYNIGNSFPLIQDSKLKSIGKFKEKFSKNKKECLYGSWVICDTAKLLLESSYFFFKTKILKYVQK